MQPPRASWLDRAARLGRLVETTALAALVAAMIGLAAGQILMRNMLGSGLSWADEALRVMVLWVTMVGAVAASREQRHVSIDVLSRYLPRSWQAWASMATNGFVALVCALLAWASYGFVAGSVEVDDRVFAGQLPAWTVQAILPVAFALLAYRYAVSSLSALLHGAPRAASDR